MTKFQPKRLFQGGFWGSTLLLLAAGLFVGGVNLFSGYDDAYITYRFAYRLATGQGFTYNPGEVYFGTSAPLYGLLLGLLGLLNPDWIPFFGGALCTVSLIALSLGLNAIGREAKLPLAGLAAGLFVTFHPLLPRLFSGEMIPQAALLAWSTWFYIKGRFIHSAGLAGIATLVRPDALIFAALLAVYHTVRYRKLPLHSILVYSAIVAPFALVALLYFGEALPSTAGNKIAQVQSGTWRPFVDDLIYNWKTNPIYLNKLTRPFALVFYLGLAHGVLAIWRQRTFDPLVLWGMTVAITYHALRLPFYHWYSFPFFLALCVLAGLGVQQATLANRIPMQATVAALLFVALWRVPESLAPRPDITPSLASYTKVGKWLRDNAPPGASVGHCEIGFLGYYSQRPIVDPLGLIAKGVSRNVAEGQIAQEFERARPDYIVYLRRFEPLYLAEVTRSSWFQQEYRIEREFSTAREPLTLYRRISSPELSSVPPEMLENAELLPRPASRQKP